MKSTAFNRYDAETGLKEIAYVKDVSATLDSAHMLWFIESCDLLL